MSKKANALALLAVVLFFILVALAWSPLLKETLIEVISSVHVK